MPYVGAGDGVEAVGAGDGAADAVAIGVGTGLGADCERAGPTPLAKAAMHAAHARVMHLKTHTVLINPHDILR
jgi:hypothetical protein